VAIEEVLRQPPEKATPPPSGSRPVAAGRPRPRREREEEVLVWPDLVFIEFVAAVLFTLTFIVLSVFIDAPLLNKANPDITPNPSKAPWYFLNLQEMLLHMHPAWAGVLVPVIALAGLAVIPYIDRSGEGRGIWFGTERSVRIAVFAAFYAVLVTFLLILFDAGKFEPVTRWFPGLGPVQEEVTIEVSPGYFETATYSVDKGLLSARDLQGPPSGRWAWSIGHLDWPEDFDHIPLPFNDVAWIPWEGMAINLPVTLVEQIIPIGMIFFLSVLLIFILWRIGWVRNTHDVMIVLFTGFMATYLALTITGSFFRGSGQQLVPPWDVKVDPG
jgi:menaquinol-cytochrome c reductase cytochrome b/c subunit